MEKSYLGMIHEQQKPGVKLSLVSQKLWLTNGEVMFAVMDNLFIFDCE